ncbi:hypothetical protein CAEBREN_07486 [Caenorhabditis brenneri]|uniref:Uncharacterized protein n=1 Tax=Caenorhabditis brenneri TaxID=135651 RepID=G0NDI6_CAEBE|nr:hypothetical protein CAEBREN_07486 [Caenorhabditis brenneri]
MASKVTTTIAVAAPATVPATATAAAASTAAASTAAPATSTTATAQTPPQKLLISRCIKDRSRLVGVRRSNGTYYLYNYDSDLDKMIPHLCSCQVKTYETNLQPMYSAQSEKLGCTVIFMYNTITCKREQYVYHFESDHFEEVENTGLVYNPTQTSYYNVVAMLKGPHDEQVMIERDHTGSLRKLNWRGGAFKVMASSRVESLMMKQLAVQDEQDELSSEYDSEYDSEEEESEYNEESVGFDKYIDSVESVFLSSCTHQRIIVAFNYHTYGFRGFSYNDTTNQFQILECGCEPEIQVRENHLCPKYTDFCSQDKVYVMHVFNSLTGIMEKYCLNGNGLKQVHYPELVYNCAKMNTSPVILVSTHPTSTLVFLRDANGRLSREVFCPVQMKYVTTSPEPVKTFIVQKKEAEKRKQEERKLKRKEQEEKAQKKAAEEKERQDQEALLQALSKETLQTAERIAKKTTERAAALKKQRAEKQEKDEKAALDALKKTMAEAVNGPTVDQEKPRDAVDVLESELNKISSGTAPTAPIKPARVPKVPLTSTISQTDISRQIPRPLTQSPAVQPNAVQRASAIERFLTNDMSSLLKATAEPKLNKPTHL